jgi:hypothetical protein
MYLTKTYKRYKNFELWGGQNRRNSVDYMYFLTDREDKGITDKLIAVENNKTGKIEFEDISDIKKVFPRITDDILTVFFDTITYV